MTIPNLIIRDETTSDVAGIRALTATAFENMKISDHTEQYVIDGLRDAGALTVSLVADLDGKLVGHIAFSPVSMSDSTPGWYGLGPVSVLPAHQRQGMGKALIQAGLARLQEMGAKGCCLVGHPEYYGQFGFVHPYGLVHEGVPPEAFFALSLAGPMPLGKVQFHPAFFVSGPQA